MLPPVGSATTAGAAGWELPAEDAVVDGLIPERAEKSSEPLIRFVGAGVGEGAVVSTR